MKHPVVADRDYRHNRLDSVMQSLDDRSNFSVGFHDYTLWLDGRNGFHATQSYSEGHGYKGVIILDNDLIISRKPIPFRMSDNWYQFGASVPKSVINRAFRRSFQVPTWWEDFVYVCMRIQPKVSLRVTSDLDGKRMTNSLFILPEREDGFSVGILNYGNHIISKIDIARSDVYIRDEFNDDASMLEATIEKLEEIGVAITGIEEYDTYFYISGVSVKGDEPFKTAIRHFVTLHKGTETAESADIATTE